MLRFLADENFHGDIVRGLRLRRPEIDLVRAQDLGLEGTADPDLLAWAAENNRILLTHDRATIPDFVADRLAAGEFVPGVFVITRRVTVREAIDELLLIDECSELSEWVGVVVYLPL